MTSVLAVAFPVFAVIAAGLLAGRFNFANANDAAALNRFIFRFAMPAALFGLMAGASGLSAADGKLALSYGLPAFLVLGVSYLLARKIFALPAPEAGAHAFASTIGNAVFLGLPIALAVEGWARPFVVLMLVEGILVLGAGAALMAPPGGKTVSRLTASRDFFVRPLKNPIVAAALAGFVIGSLGIHPEGPVKAFFDLLGRAAGPTALFSLGLFLATHPLPLLKESARKLAAITVVKMAILPACALTLAYLLGVTDPTYVGAIALFTVTPVGVVAYIMSSQHGYYVAESVAAIAVSTALSVLTVSAVLIMFA